MNAILAALGLLVAVVVIVLLALSSASASAAGAASAMASAQATGAAQIASTLSCALLPFALVGAVALGAVGASLYARVRGRSARAAPLPPVPARPVIVQVPAQALPGAQPAHVSPEQRAAIVRVDDDDLLDNILSRW